MMLLFACDLDNTLMFSHRHRRPEDICVEWLDGKEQGFMAPGVWDLLGKMPLGVRLLPVTTRSIEQYRRIRWPEGAEPEYAVTSNGGILLGRDGPDPAWLEAARTVAEPCRKALMGLYKELPSQSWCLRRRMVDGLYLFAVCPEGTDMEACAALYRGKTTLTVEPSGRKLYFFPPGLNKGAAVEAARRRFAPCRLVCAGDSALDLPMLRLADLALVPNGKLAEQAAETDVRVCPEETRFSEFILGEVLHMAAERD